MIKICVQPGPFDQAQEIAQLCRGREDIGALTTFTGIVRGDDDLSTMMLEHYPAMTEKALQRIVDYAQERWPVIAGRVVHRHGTLLPGDPIVFVAMATAHRGDAFAAAEYVMDALKTRAPFWKKETRVACSQWVAPRAADDEQAARWGAGDTCPRHLGRKSL